MQSFKMKATVVLAAIAVIVIFAFMSTDIECCEKPDRKLQESIFAGQNGNLDEIRALYAKAKMDEIPALEKYWALEGALKGDPELQGAC